LFNLIITSDDSAWDGNPYPFSRDRIISQYEYTVKDIALKYNELSESKVQELKEIPCVFAHEGISGFFRVGYINELRLRNSEVVIGYEFDKFIPVLPTKKLYDNKFAFDINSDFEFNRTHWALKDVDLFAELVRCGFITQELAKLSINSRKVSSSGLSSMQSINGSVFIVHGHDELAKTEAARFVESLGLKAIILHEQINQSQTIIEKFEKHASQAAFAVVLLTPDDVGYAKDNPNNHKFRARQNVIFELGFFTATLTRKKVSVLFKEGVEIPTDFAGVVYTPMDSTGGWKLVLAKEMKASGLNIDLNRAL
jgi:predicted nucleotide-binding protein